MTNDKYLAGSDYIPITVCLSHTYQTRVKLIIHIPTFSIDAHIL